MSTPVYPPTNETADKDLETRVKQDAADVAATARRDFKDVGEEVKHQAEAIGDEAKAQADNAINEAKGFAGDQKNRFAGQIDGVAGGLSKAADELEGEGQAAAPYLRMAADRAHQLTGALRDNDVDDLVAKAQDFGRKQPAAFLGAAALLGFAASRFVTASASRRTAPPSPARPAAVPAAAAPAPARPYSQPMESDDVGY
ncbi:hypothetical protein [Devosia sp.]|uniref:hypothetical protein n=1 Tax=Devosia sp. TaxID=1871048 RepID=UPI003A90F23B